MDAVLAWFTDMLAAVVGGLTGLVDQWEWWHAYVVLAAAPLLLATVDTLRDAVRFHWKRRGTRKG